MNTFPFYFTFEHRCIFYCPPGGGEVQHGQESEEKPETKQTLTDKLAQEIDEGIDAIATGEADAEDLKDLKAKAKKIMEFKEGSSFVDLIQTAEIFLDGLDKQSKDAKVFYLKVLLKDLTNFSQKFGVTFDAKSILTSALEQGMTIDKETLKEYVVKSPEEIRQEKEQKEREQKEREQQEREQKERELQEREQKEREQKEEEEWQIKQERFSKIRDKYANEPNKIGEMPIEDLKFIAKDEELKNSFIEFLGKQLREFCDIDITEKSIDSKGIHITLTGGEKLTFKKTSLRLDVGAPLGRKRLTYNRYPNWEKMGKRIDMYKTSNKKANEVAKAIKTIPKTSGEGSINRNLQAMNQTIQNIRSPLQEIRAKLNNTKLYNTVIKYLDTSSLEQTISEIPVKDIKNSDIVAMNLLVGHCKNVGLPTVKIVAAIQRVIKAKLDGFNEANHFYNTSKVLMKERSIATTVDIRLLKEAKATPGDIYIFVNTVKNYLANPQLIKDTPYILKKLIKESKGFAKTYSEGDPMYTPYAKQLQKLIPQLEKAQQTQQKDIQSRNETYYKLIDRYFIRGPKSTEEIPKELLAFLKEEERSLPKDPEKTKEVCKKLVNHYLESPATLANIPDEALQFILKNGLDLFYARAKKIDPANIGGLSYINQYQKNTINNVAIFLKSPRGRVRFNNNNVSFEYHNIGSDVGSLYYSPQDTSSWESIVQTKKSLENAIDLLSHSLDGTNYDESVFREYLVNKPTILNNVAKALPPEAQSLIYGIKRTLSAWEKKLSKKYNME